MDLDAYVAAHREEWQRLDELVRRRRLDGAEADEILDLYQRVATHLSVVRSAAPDPSLVTYLSSLLARARTRSAGVPDDHAGPTTRRFFTETFPAALYRTRRWWLVTLLANVVVAFVLGWWFVAHPQVESGAALARRGRPARQQPTSRATTASSPPPTSPHGSGPTTPGSPRCASRSACSGCR